MVGIDSVLALGLHRKFGWKIAAIAGVAAASPDWDGVTLLAGAEFYDRSHRVWGHNLFACALVGVAMGLFDYRFDLVGRIGRRLVKLVRLEVPDDAMALRTSRDVYGAAAWTLTAMLAGLSHLPADIVVSGHATYSDWGVQLLWPLTDRAWAYPRVSWGDVGITVLFAAGAALMVWRPKRTQLLAAMTLMAVVIYVLVRPWFA